MKPNYNAEKRRRELDKKKKKEEKEQKKKERKEAIARGEIPEDEDPSAYLGTEDGAAPEDDEAESDGNTEGSAGA